MGRPLKIKQSTTTDIGFNAFSTLTDPVIPTGFTSTDFLGVVGGANTSIATATYPVVACSANINGGGNVSAYIITQKGSSQFLVANAVGAVNGATHSNASVTVCTLVNTADPANVAANASALSSAATMCITGYTTANAVFAAKRITSKHVYSFSDIKYRYRHAATQVATAIFANVVVH
jgi:hypothetical protein